MYFDIICLNYPVISFPLNPFFSTNPFSTFLSISCDLLTLIRVKCMGMGEKLFTSVWTTHHWFYHWLRT